MASGQGLGGLVLQLGLAAGPSSAALTRVVAGLVVIVLGVYLFGDDGHLLPHLRTGGVGGGQKHTRSEVILNTRAKHTYTHED